MDVRPEVTETLQTPIRELTTGSTFAGRYQVIEELGHGGMGRVYKVQDTDIKEKVALKLLRPEITLDKETVERFSNELKLARKISHRNVCRMFDLGRAEGTTFITMEFVPGEDLKSFIHRSKQLNIGTALSIAKQVCEGLEEAHRLGVIHRDLKPGNIMIDKDGDAKIMDFGIARSLSGRGITGAGVLIGTPEYMSPEQVEGKDIDQRSDIYSLGVILYEMVTGRLPFAGDTPLSVAHKHKYEAPEDPKKLNAQLPDDLARVILKCLAKDRNERFQSAAELRTELGRIEKSLPTIERVAPGPGTPIRKPFTSKEITVKFQPMKLVIPALVFLLLVAAGIVIWRVLRHKEATPVPSGGKPSLAVMYFENLSDQKDLDKILVNMLTINLSRYEGLEVVSAQRLFDILKQLGKQDAETIDKKTATEVANRAGVKTMLLGSIIKLGGKIRISPQLIKVKDGSVIATEQVDGSKVDDIFSMVDELTAKIGTRLGILSAAQKGEKLKVEDVTTTSFEAYQYYQKGNENFWRWAFSDALKNYEQAIAIDPTFAMAHLMQGSALSVNGAMPWDPFADLTAVRKSVGLAKKYALKATEKEQRYIDVIVAFYNRQYETAGRLGSDFVKRYPDDKEATFILGFINWVTGQYDQSIKAFERALEIDPTYANAYNQLAYTYSYLNDHEKAIPTIKKYLALQPDVDNPYDSAFDIYMNAGRYDDALQICQDALKQNPGWASFNLYQGWAHLLKGDVETAHEDIRRAIEHQPASTISYTRQNGCIALFEGKYGEALKEFQKAAGLAQSEKKVGSEMYSRLELGKMFAALNQYSKALEEYSLAEKISGQVYRSDFNPVPVIANYFAGIAMVKNKDYAGAKALAGTIEKTILSEKLDDFYKDFYYLLLGELSVAQGDSIAAKGALEKCSVVIETFSPNYRVAEARTYALEGAPEKAIKAYLDCQNTLANSKQALNEYFYYFLESSRVDYYVAQLYEKQGNKVKAIEHYTKALERWKNADPGIPEVEDARKRLATLKG
jgi:serine/threonine protein kinase/Tfp pilus assembly protein PilF